MRALITTTPSRAKDLPDVPTAREAGYPQLEAIVGWSALYGPPNMPREVMDRLSTTLAKVAKDARWIAATEKAGSIPYVQSEQDSLRFAGEQFGAYQRLGRNLQIELK